MSESIENEQVPGLVISSITGGEEPPKQDETREQENKLDQLNEVKEKLPQVKPPGLQSRESSHFVSLSPASIQVSKKEPHRKKSDNYQPRRPIAAWSAKSRSNMVARYLTLDYSPLFEDEEKKPAFITLTYPSQWEVVVPDGQTFKRHVQALQKRFEVAYGHKLRGLWKMEFQRRGAPHLHVLTTLSTDLEQLRQWFSYNWADIVSHPDHFERQKHEAAGTRIDEWKNLESFKAYLIAVYFSKHSSPSGVSVKNYQHQVPELWVQAGNVGRFWGYWGLSPAVVKAQVSEEDALFIKRTLRRWHVATSKPVRVRVARTNIRTGSITYRWTHRKSKRMSGKGGFLSVPDGVSMGELLALALESRGQSSPVLEQRQEISDFSVLGFDGGIRNSQLGVSFRKLSQQVLCLPVKFPNPLYGTPNSTFLVLDGFGGQGCVWRQPTHVNQDRTGDSPYSFGKVSPTSVQFSLIGFIAKFRRGTPSQSHGLRNRVVRLFNMFFGQINKFVRHIFLHDKKNIT